MPENTYRNVIKAAIDGFSAIQTKLTDFNASSLADETGLKGSDAVSPLTTSNGVVSGNITPAAMVTALSKLAVIRKSDDSYASGKIGVYGLDYTGLAARNGNEFIITSPAGITLNTAGLYNEQNLTIKLSGSSNITAENIKYNTTILGVTGSFTGDANATAADILSNKTAYVQGSKVTGSIPTVSMTAGAGSVSLARADSVIEGSTKVNSTLLYPTNTDMGAILTTDEDLANEYYLEFLGRGSGSVSVGTTGYIIAGTQASNEASSSYYIPVKAGSVGHTGGEITSGAGSASIANVSLPAGVLSPNVFQGVEGSDYYTITGIGSGEVNMSALKYTTTPGYIPQNVAGIGVVSPDQDLSAAGTYSSNTASVPYYLRKASGTIGLTALDGLVTSSNAELEATDNSGISVTGSGRVKGAYTIQTSGVLPEGVAAASDAAGFSSNTSTQYLRSITLGADSGTAKTLSGVTIKATGILSSLNMNAGSRLAAFDLGGSIQTLTARPGSIIGSLTGSANITTNSAAITIGSNTTGSISLFGGANQEHGIRIDNGIVTVDYHEDSVGGQTQYVGTAVTEMGSDGPTLIMAENAGDAVSIGAINIPAETDGLANLVRTSENIGSGSFYKFRVTASGNSKITKEGWIEEGSLTSASGQEDFYILKGSAPTVSSGGIPSTGTRFEIQPFGYATIPAGYYPESFYIYSNKADIGSEATPASGYSLDAGIIASSTLVNVSPTETAEGSGLYALTNTLGISGTLHAATPGWFSSGNAVDNSVLGTVGTIEKGSITNNATLGEDASSSGTIAEGAYIKVSKGYYHNDVYYKAWETSGTYTATGPVSNLPINSYRKLTIAEATGLYSSSGSSSQSGLTGTTYIGSAGWITAGGKAAYLTEGSIPSGQAFTLNASAGSLTLGGDLSVLKGGNRTISYLNSPVTITSQSANMAIGTIGGSSTLAVSSNVGTLNITRSTGSISIADNDGPLSIAGGDGSIALGSIGGTITIDGTDSSHKATVSSLVIASNGVLANLSGSGSIGTVSTTGTIGTFAGSSPIAAYTSTGTIGTMTGSRTISVLGTDTAAGSLTIVNDRYGTTSFTGDDKTRIDVSNHVVRIDPTGANPIDVTTSSGALKLASVSMTAQNLSGAVTVSEIDGDTTKYNVYNTLNKTATPTTVGWFGSAASSSGVEQVGTIAKASVSMSGNLTPSSASIGYRGTALTRTDGTETNQDYFYIDVIPTITTQPISFVVGTAGYAKLNETYTAPSASITPSYIRTAIKAINIGDRRLDTFTAAADSHIGTISGVFNVGTLNITGSIGTLAGSADGFTLGSIGSNSSSGKLTVTSIISGKGTLNVGTNSGSMSLTTNAGTGTLAIGTNSGTVNMTTNANTATIGTNSSSLTVSSNTGTTTITSNGSQVSITTNTTDGAIGVASNAGEVNIPSNTGTVKVNGGNVDKGVRVVGKVATVDGTVVTNSSGDLITTSLSGTPTLTLTAGTTTITSSYLTTANTGYAVSAQGSVTATNSGTAKTGTGWITNASVDLSGTKTGSSTTATKYIIAGSIHTSSTDPGESYTPNTTAVVPADGWLYISAGWIPNTKISLSTLIPDDGSYSNAGSGHILSGYEAYDVNGHKLIGTIATITPDANYYTATSSAGVGGLAAGYLSGARYIKTGALADVSGGALSLSNLSYSSGSSTYLTDTKTGYPIQVSTDASVTAITAGVSTAGWLAKSATKTKAAQSSSKSSTKYIKAGTAKNGYVTAAGWIAKDTSVYTLSYDSTAKCVDFIFNN